MVDHLSTHYFINESTYSWINSFLLWSLQIFPFVWGILLNLMRVLKIKFAKETSKKVVRRWIFN